MRPFKPWLPQDARLPPAAEEALSALIEDWSREWFPREGLHLAGSFEPCDGFYPEFAGGMWQVSGDDLAVESSDTLQARLGALALAIAPLVGTRPDDDIALLCSVGNECLEDLQRRLSLLLAPDAAAGWSDRADAPRFSGHRAQVVATGEEPVLAIVMSRAAYIRLIKSRLPVVHRSGPLGDARDALQRLEITLSANLGSSTLSFAELSGLAIGDVIVLDRKLDAAVPLNLDGKPFPGGNCAIVDRDGAAALKILQAPVG